MESYILKGLKIKNPDKEYPSNIGQKWTTEEELLLLEELNKDTDIEIIAKDHNRTIGGINSRRREIAYKMYLKNVSIEKIVEETKLNIECIEQTIEKRQNSNQKNNKKYTQLMKNDVAEMKNDIKELKNTIKELVEMLKAVYEFEDA